MPYRAVRLTNPFTAVREHRGACSNHNNVSRIQAGKLLPRSGGLHEGMLTRSALDQATRLRRMALE
jgi:hypothetical protein